MSKLIKMTIVFVTCLLVVSAAMADSPIVSFFEPDPILGSEFGKSVIGLNDWVIVGAPERDTGRFDTQIGRVFVHQEADSQHLQTIENPSPDSGDRFGHALAPFTVSNPLKFIIGVPYDDHGAFNGGIAYVFWATSGNRACTLRNPDPDDSDLFGYAVAFVHPNMILVGAPGENSNIGIAYLFNASTCSLLRTLQNPDPDNFDDFGKSVAGSYKAIVAATEDDLGGNDAGTVYIFDPADGSLLITLQNPEADRGRGGSDVFGHSLIAAFLETDGFSVCVLVGAPGEDAGGTDIGAAYLFDEADGELLHTFENPDPDNDDSFGTAVIASYPNYALVSAKFDDASASNAGTAYLFDTSNGNHVRSFNKQNANAGDELGYALGLGEAGFLVGVYRDDTEAANAGAVYLFQPDRGPEISLHGNGNIIRNNDITPSGTDGTSFGRTPVDGGSITREFTILNIGSDQLSLTGDPLVKISDYRESRGSNAFEVVQDPEDTVAADGGTTTFRIRFDPSSTGGVLRAQVTISNNDGDEGSYRFNISGIGEPGAAKYKSNMPIIIR